MSTIPNYNNHWTFSQGGRTTISPTMREEICSLVDQLEKRGMSIKEISRMLGWSTSLIQSIRYRATKDLREGQLQQLRENFLMKIPVDILNRPTASFPYLIGDRLLGIALGLKADPELKESPAESEFGSPLKKAKTSTTEKSQDLPTNSTPAEASQNRSPSSTDSLPVIQLPKYTLLFTDKFDAPTLSLPEKTDSHPN